jgi:hypothetical protein
MPSVSKAQQHFMGAAYARAKSGHPRSSDPDMSVSQLRDFASTKTKGLPGRAPKEPRRFGGGPVRIST